MIKDFIEGMLLLSGSSVKIHILKCLYEKPKNAKQILEELSKKKLISKSSYSNIHRLLEELRKSGFVTFKEDKHAKGKPKTAQLTPKAMKLFKKLSA